MLSSNGDLRDLASCYSIGHVAKDTGLSEATLRIWEQRYGSPRPRKSPTGQRRYSHAELLWLRRVAAALALGHRPAVALRVDNVTLDRMLQPPANLAASPSLDGDLDHMITTFRADALRAARLRAWRKLDCATFLDECLGGLLHKIGRDWVDGKIEIRHEHFVTGVVQDVLRELRAKHKPVRNGPILLVTTLPGKQHDLGVHMTLLAAAVLGVRSRAMGSDTPVDQIVVAAREIGAAAVGVSVSLANGGVNTDRILRELRSALPASTTLLVGGRGARVARRGLRGRQVLHDFRGAVAMVRYHAAIDLLERRSCRAPSCRRRRFCPSAKSSRTVVRR